MSFLQLTPENIKQARSLSYPEAFKLDQTYKFDPNFKGGVSRSKYIGEGLKSLIGLGDQNIGGATPLTRKLALDATDLFKSGVGFAAKRVAPIFSFFGSTELGADDVITPKMRDEVDITDELDDYYEKGEMMPNVEDARRSLLERILEFAPFIGDKSLTGILTNALGGAKDKLTGFRDAVGRRLGPAPFGTSQAAFDALTPSQQQSVASIYGQGGIMQGYNPVSAFGRGPVGAIENRIANILERKAAGKRYGKTNLARLQQALTDVGGGSDDSGGYSQSAVDAGIQAAEDDR